MSILRDLLPKKPVTDSAAVRQSDQLVDTARRLLHEGHAEEALEALRRARELTPMRGDIRQLAERAIDVRTRRLASQTSTPPAPAGPSAPTTASGQGALPGLIVPTAPSDRSPGKLKASRRRLETRATMEEVAANTPLPVRQPGAKRRPAQPPPSRRPASPPSSVHSARSAGVQFSPSRGLDERRLPRLNFLGWLGVIGVAGIVMIASSAILHTGTNTIFNIPEKSSAETAVSDEAREQVSQAKEEIASGEPLRAVARLQLAVERWPDQKQLLEPTLSLAYSKRAESLRKDRAYDRAAEDFGKAASLSPADASLRISQGEALYMAGRIASDRKETHTARQFYKDSITAYAQALAIDPHNPQADLGKAKVHGAQDERKEAVACYKDILENNPDSPEAVEADRMLKMLTGR